MAFFKYSFFLLALFLGTLDAKEEKQTYFTYINIDANVRGTPILLEGKEIGKTPIKAYKVQADAPFVLTAIANKEYYKKDLAKTIEVRKNTLKDIYFKLEKAKAKLYLIGEKAQLFIDNKFIKELNEENRIIETEAGTNKEIFLENGYKMNRFYKNIKADQFYEIPYVLYYISKDVRLYTITVENLMWEDTKHAADTQIDWEHAKEYCEDLELAEFTDWKLPSIEQLTRLETKYKDQIYYGYGKTFYWSSDTSMSKDQIWDYADSRDFENSKLKKPIKELAIGYVRCVRELSSQPLIEKRKDLKEKYIDKNKVSAVGQSIENIEKAKELIRSAMENGQTLQEESAIEAIENKQIIEKESPKKAVEDGQTLEKESVRKDIKNSQDDKKEFLYDTNLTKDLDKYMLK
jgi:hypothetical protein